MLNTTEAIAEVCMKIKKYRSYSTVPVPADRDNTLWSARSVFINDNIKTFGEEGELRLNIIFSIPDPFIVLAHRTEFITDSHFKPIEEAKTGGLMKKIMRNSYTYIIYGGSSHCLRRRPAGTDD